MKRVCFCLLAVVFLAAMGSATAADFTSNAALTPIADTAAADAVAVPQAVPAAFLDDPTATQPAFLSISGEAAPEGPTSNIIICDTRTCECYDCQFGGPCVPVPPPSWCQPA